MVPSVLTLHTADGLHELACPLGASIDLGTHIECEIVLEGAEIMPRHCALTRIGERRLRIKRLDDEAKFSVNDVEAPELEVDAPFRFGIGGETIMFDLVAEEESEAETRAADSLSEPVATSEEAPGPQRAGRRDYLLQPGKLRPRVPEGVSEVRLPPVPESTTPEVPPDSPKEEAPPTEAVEAKEKSETESDAPSSRVLFAGLAFCGLMVGAILWWQHYLDAIEPAATPSAAQKIAIVRDFSAGDFLRAGASLRVAGLPAHAEQLLLPLAEQGDAEAVHELALVRVASGGFDKDPAGVLRGLAESGNRRALADLVVAVESPMNPSRHSTESFQHLEFATELGEPGAWMPLGERLEQGLGVEKDLEAALVAFKRAREAGDVRVAAKLAAEQEALRCVAGFVRSWNEVSVAVVLDHISAEPLRYFSQEKPAMEALLRTEERLRILWPLRRISVSEGAAATLRSFEEVEVKQPIQFELQRGERIARGKGVVTCVVRTGDAGWRIVSVADELEITELLPAADRFVTASSLLQLAPAFSLEEQIEESRLEILDRMRGIEETQDFKPVLTLILNTAMSFPKEEFWRPFADKLCDRMARELFSQGQWLDAAWAAPVHQLAELGSVSAMLLEGHLQMAGYGYSRDERRGAALYQKAYESGKRRDARFYHAEALFQGRGVVQDFDKAGALVLSFMSRSKHPLEAYLAAHLLWRKAEVDPSLWQDVYDTLSRVAEKHPPAKHLAAMVLLNHGNSTRERKTGFVALKAAAESGVQEAMKNLAKCYQDGVGCEKDLQAATLWKQKAAITEPVRRRHYTEFEE